MSEQPPADSVKEWRETPDVTGAYPRLTDAQLDVMRARGNVRPTSAGDVLFSIGDQPDAFYVVLTGLAGEAAAGEGSQRRVLAVHGTGRFLGETNLLMGLPVFVAGVVLEAGSVLEVPLPQLRDLITQDSPLADLLLRSFLLRRPLQLRLGAGLRIIGSCFSLESRRLREFAARNRLLHRWIDVEQDQAADALLQQLGVTTNDIPVVIWRDGTVLRNPTNQELAQRLGLRAAGPLRHRADLVVVGAGPAGLAAAVYGASEGLDTVVFDAVASGGQAGTSSRIENYLGFPAGVSGAELTDRALIQASKFGARICVPVQATGMSQADGSQVINVDGAEDILARVVVLATGAEYQRLDLDRIDEFEQTSVYYAATEVEANLCRDDAVVVVGGGNSAGQACLFLARSAASVTLVVRGDRLEASMSRYLSDRVEKSPQIQVKLHTVVRQLRGDLNLDSVVVEDTSSGTWEELAARAMFVFIGARPHSEWLAGRVALDRSGFVLTGRGSVFRDVDPSDRHRDVSPTQQGIDPDELTREFLETSLPGVFAVGDVRSGSVKRVASAVGEGSMAIRFTHEYLSSTGAS